MSHDKFKFNIIIGDFNAKISEEHGKARMGDFGKVIKSKEDMSLLTVYDHTCINRYFQRDKKNYLKNGQGEVQIVKLTTF